MEWIFVFPITYLRSFYMITEQGIVQEVAATKAFIVINRTSACAGCHGQSGCRPSESKDMIIEAINELNAKVGDRVQISLPTGSLLKATFLVYFLPVVALVIGAIAGGKLGPFLLGFNSTLGSILCGFGAMAAVLLAVKWFDRSIDAKPNYWPRITRILPPLQCQ
jgi:sigma-E factor negative regulatory protein RseC